MSNRHQEMIIPDTSCRPADAPLIENIMREEVFHSPLDRQSRAEFRVGARKAARFFSQNLAAYDDLFATGRAAFAQMKQAAATQNSVAYDI